MKRTATVSEYIATAPAKYQKSLRQLRRLIKQLAPKAQERISYGMPYYEFKGRLVYFAAMKDYIGLYIPPPIIAQHAKELQSYKTTKSAVHLPLQLPRALITKLVKARLRYNKNH